jgi:2-methylisocitrate lyase-like PEP mutase family enzyme
VAIIAAARTAAPELVVNARIDTFIRGDGEVAHAVERGNTYLAAGADCVYPIGAAPFSAIDMLVRGIDDPINILVSAAEPLLDELERLGVARVTFGWGFAGVALAESARLAALALER